MEVSDYAKSLIDKYKAEKDSLPSYQLAKLENQIWTALKSARIDTRLTNDRGRAMQQGEYFSKFFGAKRGDVQSRLALLNQERWIGEIWGELDRGLKPTSAERIMRAARDLAGSTKIAARQEALNLLLEDYRNTGKLPAKPNSNSEPPKAEDSKDSGGKDPETIRKWQVSRQFSLDLEELTSKFIDELVGDSVSERDRDRLKSDYTSFIATATDSFRKEIRKLEQEAKDEHKNKAKIGRRRLDHACEVLGIRCKFGQPPEGGWNNARMLYSRRVEQLHPDKNDGSEAMLQEYQQVVQAFNVLRDYRKQIEENNNGNS